MTTISIALNTSAGKRGGVGVPMTPVEHSSLAEFRARLAAGGRRDAIQFLNRRTPHRFTGIFQFAGEILKSVELVDKWDWTVRRCDDIPIASAYCAHLQRTGEPLVVVDGLLDVRVPWMKNSPVVSYCGAVIESRAGQAWGALCHFDLSPCESKRSDVPLLVAAAHLLWPVLAAGKVQPAGAQVG